jgi:DNA repair protein RecO (recombination protein O)
MALGKSSAVVIGSFDLGESDRVVTFYSREHGKIRGITKASRRMRSRFSGALELFTLGELVFFDTGRSELVRVDHFDVLEPFAALRVDLERLGQAAWIVECVGRLTAERDPHAALYGLLTRALRACAGGAAPARVAVCFGARCLDVLGHRPRLDRCVECGRAYPFARPALDEGGVVCETCAAQVSGATAISPAAVAALGRLRAARWEEALAQPLGRIEAELRAALEAHMTRLIGQPTRTAKFLREVRRLSETIGERQ